MPDKTAVEIPTLTELEAMAEDIDHGSITIELTIVDGKIVYQDLSEKKRRKVA